MDGQALWHVLIDNEQHGPLTKAQVRERLRNGILAGNNLIWRPGFSNWKPISEIAEFWQPPPPNPVENAPEYVEEPGKTDAPAGRKLSLWRSANVGLLLGALGLFWQIASGGGFQLANYAHTASGGTIGALIGQTLWASPIFVLVAALYNLTLRRELEPSRASAVWGALTFVTLLVGILGSLVAYGEYFFSSTDLISGESRKTFVTDSQRACVRKQRSLGLNITEAQMDTYCTCVTEQMASKTTYKDMGGVFDPSSVDQKQKIEAAINACR